MKRSIGILALLVVWELGARARQSPLFPPMTESLLSAVKLARTGEIFPDIAASLRTIVLGFGIAATIGFALGILVTEWKFINTVLGPVIDAMRPIAALTIFPLLILLLGLGVWSKAFVIMWTSWPAVVLNTAQGIRKVDQEVIEAGQLDGAGRWPLLLRIKLPLAAPMIMTGLRIGLSGGWISLVSAEMLGSSEGLGFSILAYSQTFRFPEMYATIIFIATIGLTMNIVMAWIQNRTDYQEVSRESPFIRFGDRASSFALDSLRTNARSRRAAGGEIRSVQSLRSRLRGYRGRIRPRTRR